MGPTVDRVAFARTERPATTISRGNTMASVSVVKTKSAAKAAKSKKDADARLKQAQRAAVLLKQVSDPTRLQVITMLSEGEKHVGALCEALTQSQPAVSHHLALLRHGGIIAPRRQGKNNFYSLTGAGEQLASIVKSLVG
jgi:DNA-binding transcriptional ArsR family regulator